MNGTSGRAVYDQSGADDSSDAAETPPKRGRGRLHRMRSQTSVSSLLVLMLALMGGCSPDEPDDVAVLSEPPVPNRVVINDVGGSQAVLSGTPERPVQIQAEEECRQLVELEARVREMRRRYSEQHPQVQAARNEILRLRSGLPANGTFCSEQLEQLLRAVEQLRQD